MHLSHLIFKRRGSVLADRSRDVPTQRRLCDELPSVSLTSVSSAHFIRVSVVHLFLLRGGLHWLYGEQSLQRVKERRGEGERKGEEGDNSFTLRTKRSGNHPGERNSRPRGEAARVGGWGGVHTRTRTNTLPRNVKTTFSL